MPDLESQIAQWRRAMRASRIKPAVVEELECHLRDDIDAQVASGLSAEAALASSVVRLGRADEIKMEFEKVPMAARARLWMAWLTLAGIPCSNASTHMNTMNPPVSLEPRWATYTKAAVFLSPALLLTIFAAMFLLPKLQQICLQAGVTLPWVYHAVAFMAEHPVLVTAAILAPFGLLEWRWSRWPQFRRVSLGSTVFLLNASVLALLTLMVISALLAAPNLARHVG